jgi:subtilisin family serine protease
VLLACAALAVAVVPSLVPVTTAGAVPAAAHDDAGLPSWWFDAMKLDAAHKQTTGKGVTVAVIDVAIDRSAADIKGADVTLRIDCLGNKLKSANADIGDHGTAMVTNLAGTGHGNAPGGLGVRGIAPDVKVLFYGMDTDVSTPAQDDCNSGNGARLVDQAVQDGADIITTSLGFVASDEMRGAVKRAVKQGVVVVSASGDRTRPAIAGHPSYPTPEDGAISVNAADAKAKPWVNNPPPNLAYGNKEYPVITAPGVAVDSSGYEEGKGWVSGGTRTGTSDAAPIVAGALALVKSKYPDATGNQLIQTLIHNPSGGTFAWDRAYGFGIVSVTRMLAQDPTGWPDENPLPLGPRSAEKKYPASVYGTAASPTASPSGDSSATRAPSPSDSGRPDSAATDSDSSGVPVWLWPVAALLVLGGIVLALTQRQRGRRPAATEHNSEDV